jgi:hypothetical protein
MAGQTLVGSGMMLLGSGWDKHHLPARAAQFVNHRRELAQEEASLALITTIHLREPVPVPALLDYEVLGLGDRLIAWLYADHSLHRNDPHRACGKGRFKIADAK